MKLVVKFLGIFMLSLMVFACTNNDSPEAVGEKFTKAGYSVDMDTFMDLLYISDDMQKDGVDVKILLKSKFKSVLDESAKMAKNHGGIDKIVSSPAEYNTDKTKAQVEVTVSFKDGSQKKSSLDLIKIDGKWLVNMK